MSREIDNSEFWRIKESELRYKYNLPCNICRDQRCSECLSRRS